MANDYDPFSLSEADIIKEAAAGRRQEWRLLRRLRLPEKFNDAGTKAVRRAVAVDVEATGLSTEKDDVIQLAILPFDYELKTGRILTIHKDLAFEALREPAVPITEEASIITGITNAMVSGRSIDSEDVARRISDADLVIAHNAYFDRVMVERHWSCFAEKPWACTFHNIDWLREGFSAGKLDHLGMQYGWFYDGHTALADCEACIALLAQTLPKSGKRVLSAVREAALRDEFLIRAVDSPYDTRQQLKDRGYRWRPQELPNGKVWWTTSTDPDAEASWLRKEIYKEDKVIPVHKITAHERYSNRVWEFDE